MKKLILLILTTIIILSCSNGKKEVLRIPITSSSPEAAKLLDDYFLNQEERRNWLNEELLKSILLKDTAFALARIQGNNLKSDSERRSDFSISMSNLDGVTDLEARLIKANYERQINGNRKRQDEIMDSLIIDYPEYYQLRLWSGNIKNNLDPKLSEARWNEAIEINPDSFFAYFQLAALHFPTGSGFTMLAPEQRNLDMGITYLEKGAEILPKSSRPSRFLGNIYRGKGEFDKALSAYQESLDIISKFEAGEESSPYANSLLMVGHVYTFQNQYQQARKFYDQAIEVSQKLNDHYWIVSLSELKAHTYIYQKDFAGAIRVLSECQVEIEKFTDIEELEKLFYLTYIEESKFRAFGHSQKEEETLASINKMKELRASQKSILLNNAGDDIQKNRIELNTSANEVSMDVWFNILFGKYERARELLSEFKGLSETRSGFNPNAMNNFYRLSGYLNLMEGYPEESIKSYANLSAEAMGNDSYHQYFLGLAQKAIGKTEESKQMFVTLANDNFATWQNSLVKNLAKAQIKTNL